RCLSVAVEEHPAAVPPAHCPGGGGTLPRGLRDATRAGGTSLHAAGPPRTGGPLLAAGGPTGQRPLSQCGSHQPLDHRYRVTQTLGVKSYEITSSPSLRRPVVAGPVVHSTRY